MNDLSARRPLKSRSTSWASTLSRTLLACGLRPNQVSTASSLCALAAAAFILYGAQVMPAVAAWVAAAVCIQLRLVCNLMDGMLAVEGGLKTANGDLYNEFPDRISDMVILAALGYAGGSTCSAALGWATACGALMTACIRMHGASLTGTHDFRGPMAKPQRMALATLACGAMAIMSCTSLSFPLLTWTLGVMCAGICITVWRRLSALSQCLHERSAHTSV
jgi:phosphatidylglycerophosphate synthase